MDPFSPRLGRTREGVQGGGWSPMAIVWPCPLTADAYVAAGREYGVPAAGLPLVRVADGVVVGLLAACPRGGAVPEDVRAEGAVRAVRGHPCAAAGFLLAWRLDTAGTAGAVIEEVPAGGAGCGRRRSGPGCRTRPRAGGFAVSGPGRREPGWRSRRLPSSSAGRRAPAADPGRFAVAAIGAAFEAACSLPGWAVLGRWRFASAVSGGRLIAATITSPFLVVGRRRFMPPIPPLPA